MFVAVVNDTVYLNNTDPFKTQYKITPADFAKERPDEKQHPIFKAEMLDRSNMMAVIPASISSHPRSADNRVWFWNCARDDLMAEYVGDCPVLAIRMRMDICAIASEKEIRFLTVPQFEEVVTIPSKNPLGILAFTPTTSGSVILAAFPYAENSLGGLHAVQIALPTSKVTRTRTFRAHEHPLACILFNGDGTYLATASTKGELINLWRTDNMQRVCRFRRGMDPALIYSLSFNSTNTLLSALSDNGTVHLFQIPSESYFDGADNLKRSALSQLISQNTSTGIRATSKFDIACRSYSQCALYNNSLFVITVDCDYHHLIYSADNSICKRIVYDKFIDPFNDTGL
ncbi:hypothetical protein GJ496_000549 [Pomphorhynchus laevis]|nr:hypothetical protein GJ496_000549 [Pomphorhynchus laevis]